MRNAAFLVAFVTAGCASSPWQRTEGVPGGTLYIPKVYAPLRTGSIYPDRKTPLKAERRPAVILVCAGNGDCRKDVVLDQAAQRGLVVLVAQRADAVIGSRPEVDSTRTGTLIVAPTSLKVEAPAPPKAEASPSSPSKKILLAALLSDEPLEAANETVLKLYSPNKEGFLPREAFRDAVEWLAGELGAR